MLIFAVDKFSPIDQEKIDQFLRSTKLGEYQKLGPGFEVLRKEESVLAKTGIMPRLETAESSGEGW